VIQHSLAALVLLARTQPQSRGLDHGLIGYPAHKRSCFVIFCMQSNATEQKKCSVIRSYYIFVQGSLQFKQPVRLDQGLVENWTFKAKD